MRKGLDAHIKTGGRYDCSGCTRQIAPPDGACDVWGQNVGIPSFAERESQ